MTWIKILEQQRAYDLLSKRAFAAKLGISTTHYLRYLRGNNWPSLEIRAKYRHFLKSDLQREFKVTLLNELRELLKD